MTSVKRIRVDEAPTASSLGRGRFVFSDDYSVFDWGRMPDSIPSKGAALCVTGAHSFALLEDGGIPTHYQGVVHGGEVRSLEAALSAGATPNEMTIELAEVLDLPTTGAGYDYDAYHAAAGEGYLIPLEVVFRNHVPVGSSLRRRTDPGEHGLAFEEWPEETVALPEPVVEFSTKFEHQDRYLGRDEADAIAGAAPIDELASVARAVNRAVTERAAAAGLTHLDGKIECLFDGGEIRVADVVGTFDENRFARDGRQVSKELLRQHHTHTQSEWVAAVREAKDQARAEDRPDWRSLCAAEPQPLAESIIEHVGRLYRAGANAYLDRSVFDVRELDELLDRTPELLALD